MKLDSMPAEMPSEEDVVAYLRMHPEFFVGRDDLLLELNIPHGPEGTISLVERQIQLLRQQNADLTDCLDHLMEIARENDRLFEKARHLVLDLLDAQTLEEVVQVVDEGLRHHFQVPYLSLILFSDKALPVGRSVRAQDAWLTLGRLIVDTRGSCGMLQPHELDFLFEADGADIGSAAVIRAGNHAVLAIGTPDPLHYKSSLGTLFLGHIAEILGRVLARFASQLESLD